MAKKRVLDVGQCRPDHAAIRYVMESLGAEVDAAYLPADALEAMKRERYDLVVINRKLDSDYSDGTDLIRMMKADRSTADIPVMLISNYPDAQEEAVSLGALPGFGKLEMMKDSVHARIRAALESSVKNPGPRRAKATD